MYHDDITNRRDAAKLTRRLAEESAKGPYVQPHRPSEPAGDQSSVSGAKGTENVKLTSSRSKNRKKSKAKQDEPAQIFAQEIAEQQRLEQQRLEQQRLEQERLEQERLEQQRLEQQRLEQQRLEQQRLEQERLEQQRVEQERAERERVEAEAAPVRTWARFGSELVEAFKSKLQHVKEWSYNNIVLPLYNATFASRMAVHFSNNPEVMSEYDRFMDSVKEQLTLEKNERSKKSPLKSFAEEIEIAMNRCPARGSWVLHQQFTFLETPDNKLAEIFYEVDRYHNMVLTARELSNQKDLINQNVNISDVYKAKMNKAYSYVAAAKYLSATNNIAAENLMLENFGPKKGILWGVSSSVFDRNPPSRIEIERFERDNRIAIAPPILVENPAAELRPVGSALDIQKEQARPRLVLFITNVCQEYARRRNVAANV